MDPPAVADVGLRLVMVGVGGLTEKVAAADGVPPLFTAVMLALMTFTIRPADTVAVSSVPLTKVVVSPVPFHCTVAPDRKPVPLTVRVKDDPPAVAETGLRLVIVGVGGLIGNVDEVDELPPVLTTVTLPLPIFAIRPVVTVAVN